MSFELLFTSAHQGLQPGTRGFCTVAASPGLPPQIANLLERLSVYQHRFPARSKSPNPQVYAHQRVTLQGEEVVILSRINDTESKTDEGRQNFLAHHRAFLAPVEFDGGPSQIVQREDLFPATWSGQPQVLATQPVQGRSAGPRQCFYWLDVAGDAGWVSKLLEAHFDGRIAYLIVEPGMPAIHLIDEALRLLPDSHRWKVTFNSCYFKQPPGVQCEWRCVLDKTREADIARQDKDAVVIDLTRNLGSPHGGRFVDEARQGIEIVPPPSRKSKTGSRDFVQSTNHPPESVAERLRQEFDEEHGQSRKRSGKSVSALLLILLVAALLLLNPAAIRQIQQQLSQLNLPVGVDENPGVGDSPLDAQQPDKEGFEPAEPENQFRLDGALPENANRIGDDQSNPASPGNGGAEVPPAVPPEIDTPPAQSNRTVGGANETGTHSLPPNPDQDDWERREGLARDPGPGVGPAGGDRPRWQGPRQDEIRNRDGNRRDQLGRFGPVPDDDIRIDRFGRVLPQVGGVEPTDGFLVAPGNRRNEERRGESRFIPPTPEPATGRAVQPRPGRIVDPRSRSRDGRSATDAAESGKTSLTNRMVERMPLLELHPPTDQPVTLCRFSQIVDGRMIDLQLLGATGVGLRRHPQHVNRWELKSGQTPLGTVEINQGNGQSNLVMRPATGQLLPESVVQRLRGAGLLVTTRTGSLETLLRFTRPAVSEYSNLRFDRAVSGVVRQGERFNANELKADFEFMSWQLERKPVDPESPLQITLNAKSDAPLGLKLDFNWEGLGLTRNEKQTLSAWLDGLVLDIDHRNQNVSVRLRVPGSHENTAAFNKEVSHFLDQYISNRVRELRQQDARKKKEDQPALSREEAKRQAIDEVKHRYDGIAEQYEVPIPVLDEFGRYVSRPIVREPDSLIAQLRDQLTVEVEELSRMASFYEGSPQEESWLEKKRLRGSLRHVLVKHGDTIQKELTRVLDGLIIPIVVPTSIGKGYHSDQIMLFQIGSDGQMAKNRYEVFRDNQQTNH